MKRLRSRGGGAPASIVARALGEERGVALVLVLFVIFTLGMMLFAFVFMAQNEIGFAGLNRDSVEALNLAEAGAQEAIQRIAINGLPDTSKGPVSYNSSLVSAIPGATGTITFQPKMVAAPAMMPVTSVATFAGIQRKVRLLVNTNPNPWEYQLYGYQVNFDGNTTPTTGNDIYSSGTVEFENYQLSPLCAAGPPAASRAPNFPNPGLAGLISPQVMGGAFVYGESIGNNTTPPCGQPVAVPTDAGTYFAECQNLQNAIKPIQTGGALLAFTWSWFGELPPTTCAADGNPALSNVAGGFSTIPLAQNYTIPVNWHPMSPQGMSAADFNAVLVVWGKGGQAAMLGNTLNVVFATQTLGPLATSQKKVPYSPANYSPPYWSAPLTLTTKTTCVPLGGQGCVMVIATTRPFCVNNTSGAEAVASGEPAGCPGVGGPWTYYGYDGSIADSSGGSSDDTGPNPNNPVPTRFVDWGLVSDDIGKAIPQTFYGNGNQNGIRFVPLYSSIDVLSYACKHTMGQGYTVFDNVDGSPACTGLTPPWLHNDINVNPETFQGTASGSYPNGPEALIITNGNGTNVGLQFSSSGGTSTKGTACTGGSAPNFNTGNWGIILATGDLTLNSNATFSGFIYTRGTISMGGGANQYFWLQGGIMTQPTAAPPTSGIMNLNNKSSFVGLCGGLPPSLGSPVFGNFAPITWEDIPLNQN